MACFPLLLRVLRWFNFPWLDLILLFWRGFFPCRTGFPMLNIALFQPEIPPNTGNIARQCVGMQARLHLIGPLGFGISDKAVKRAGLDYWPHLQLVQHPNPPAFLDWLGPRPPWLITKHGATRYDRAAWRDEDVLLFGSETRGLPPEWRQRWADHCLYIPMPGPVRSYNLSNAVALVLAQSSLAAGLFP